MKTTLTIRGTHCHSCKILIEDVCHDIPGVKSCTVNFETGEAIVDHDETFNWNRFKKEIEDLGQYTVTGSESIP